MRWYWMRCNGAGFAAGVAAGFIAAFWFFQMAPAGWNEAQQFLCIAGVSLVVSVVTALLTTPVPVTDLRRFYDRVAPFGVWPRAWRAAYRAEHRRDLARLAVALPWQVLTFLLPMGIMLRLWPQVLAGSALWLVLFAWLLRDVRRTARNPGCGTDSLPTKDAPPVLR